MGNSKSRLLVNKLCAASSILNPIVLQTSKRYSLPYLWRTLPSIVFSHDHKFVYFRIPKAANTSILYYLYQLTSDCPEEFVKWDRSRITRNHFNSAGGMSIFKGRKALKKYFFFTFSRNPYNRILSCFIEKFRIASYQKRYARLNISRERTAGDFVKFLRFLSKNGLYKDHHWIPQSDFIWPYKERLNFIGSVERLDDDLAELSRLLGLGKKCAGFSRPPGGPPKTNASRKHERYYGDHPYGREARQLVYLLYKNDFTMFNYKK